MTMDWRIVLTTFVLIFIAELGDKTQLAAMASAASAAGERSAWAVFFGASAALVLSTCIAVLLGTAFRAYLPPRLLQTAAGVLFLAFGVFWLVQAIRGAPPVVTTAAAAPRPGLLTRLALETAAEFEAAASVNYLNLAAAAHSPQLRGLFADLAVEDRCHLARVRSLATEHGDALLALAAPVAVSAPPPVPPQLDEPDRTLLKEVVTHEQATADFYQSVAAATPIPALRSALLGLAQEEQRHVARLRAWLDHA